MFKISYYFKLNTIPRFITKILPRPRVPSHGAVTNSAVTSSILLVASLRDGLSLDLF